MADKLTPKKDAESVTQWIKEDFLRNNKNEIHKSVNDALIEGVGAMIFEIDDNKIVCKAVDLRGDTNAST